jgi:Tol biopolymer transport system component
VTRFAITTSGDAALSLLATDSPLALSPDGSRIAYVGHNASAFFVRALDQLEPTRVGGSVDSRSPFFSPDSQWIAFFEGVERELKRMPASGGPAVRICAVDGERQGGAWTRDGTIVFATGNTATGLWRVNSAGSEPQMLTKPNREAGEADHVFPHAVPGRQQVLFTITPASGNLDEARIALLDLSTGAHQVVLRGGFDARYAASGHLVYATTSGLLAVPFDLDRLASTGVPVAASPPVGTTRTGAAYFDVAANGTLVYVPDAPSPEGDRILVWVDRAGRVEPIPSTPRGYLAVRLSPDGSRVASETVAASRAQLADRDIWIHDLARGTERRLTLDLGVDLSPIWSPDSTRVLFASNRGDTGTGKGGTPGPTPLAIYSQAADGSGRAERMVDEPGRAAEPIGVSPDNAWLLFRVGTGAGTGGRLMIRSLAPPRQPRPLVESSNDLAAIRGGALSPDGRWLVYEEVERNVAQLFVTPFPDVSGGRWQVSTDSGRTPRWSRDGRELFYLASRGRDQNLDTMMAVPVIPGAVWSTGAPVALFDRSVVSGTFDVAPDGERFLMLDGGREADGQPTPRTLVVVERWTEELKVKAPPGSR